MIILCMSFLKFYSLIAQLAKNLPAMQETLVWFLGWKICWRRDRLPTPVLLGFPSGSAGKESACNAGDLGLIPGLGRSPGEGKGYPFQYSGLENPMDCNSPWGLKELYRSERLSLSQLIYNVVLRKAIPRRRRNRMGRPLSPPEIHQKIIWMWSSFHKTASEHWPKTPDTQRGRPISERRWGQNIKDESRDKGFRDGDPSWEGSHEEGKVSTQEETLSQAGQWERSRG